MNNHNNNHNNNNHNNNNHNNNILFSPTTPPREADFVVDHDPFADTPDWKRTASVCSADSLPGPNGTNGYHHVTNGHATQNNNNGLFTSNNPFLTNGDAHATKAADNSQLFDQYLSNVVAQRNPSIPTSAGGATNNVLSNGLSSPSNGVYLGDCSGGMSNGSSSRSNSLDHFNVSNISEFSVNNELDFDKMNISCGAITDFPEDDFFTDDNFIPRPKSHTITCLTTEEQVEYGLYYIIFCILEPYSISGLFRFRVS